MTTMTNVLHGFKIYNQQVAGSILSWYCEIQY